MDWTLATTIVATTCAITLFTMFRERAKEKKRREQPLKEDENMEKAKTQEIKSATCLVKSCFSAKHLEVNKKNAIFAKNLNNDDVHGYGISDK